MFLPLLAPLGLCLAAPASAQQAPASQELQDELEAVRQQNAAQEARIEALERELQRPPASTGAEAEESAGAGPSASSLTPDGQGAAPPESQGSFLKPGPPTDLTSPELFDKMLAGKWYERISLRGYTQFRYTLVSDGSGAALSVPADRSAQDDQTFIIRRGRLVLSGDATSHLFFYGQLDFAASPSDGDFALQARDLYADVSVDHEKEFRFRAGLSKVPYGWVNLQSSQNRMPLERADALNSGVEGERDLGVYFYYAPDRIRKRFKELVKQGLKGSGDYGVLGIGAYTGQGPNTTDANDELHFASRATYPFELSGGQFVEIGVCAYTGDYVVETKTISVDGNDVTPEDGDGNYLDQRVAANIVVYPQPFGFEAEYTIGSGPQLSSDLLQIEDEDLHGGYLQANYKHDTEHVGPVLPFARWNYYDGARKFATNSPADFVNEVDFGVEWLPLPELEFTVMYTYTFDRTNTKVAPYDDTTDASRIGFQLQWNI